MAVKGHRVQGADAASVLDRALVLADVPELVLSGDRSEQRQWGELKLEAS